MNSWHGAAPPEWTELESSNVDAVSYDADLQRMRIRFKGSREYSYYNVPLEVYLKLLISPSAGHYVNERIVGQYPTRRGG